MFIDCNEQNFATKKAWPERPYCNHGKWIGNGTNWCSPKAARKHKRKSHTRTRVRAIQFLGGVCVQCGTEDGLEFDHKNKQNKSFNVGPIMARGWTDKLQAELEKCQLLCERCHRAKTSQDMSGSNHPSYSKPAQLNALQHEINNILGKAS